MGDQKSNHYAYLGSHYFLADSSPSSIDQKYPAAPRRCKILLYRPIKALLIPFPSLPPWLCVLDGQQPGASPETRQRNTTEQFYEKKQVTTFTLPVNSKKKNEGQKVKGYKWDLLC
jgi:hypothetical protein